MNNDKPKVTAKTKKLSKPIKTNKQNRLEVSSSSESETDANSPCIFCEELYTVMQEVVKGGYSANHVASGLMKVVLA